MKNQIYSVLQNESLGYNGTWEKGYNFYQEDLSNIDFTKDWRFNEIPGKRKESIFLGNITNPKFPLEYPIYLDNGKVLDKI